MKKVLVFAVVFSLCCASMACAEGLGGLSMPSLGSLTENVKFNPYAQVGFMRMGSNMNLPVGTAETVAGTLQIDNIDIAMADANFWTGTVGFTAKSGELLSLFASAGGILPRQFVVSGEIPVSLGGVGTSANIDFTGSKAQSWYVQSGVGLGPVLLGVYWGDFKLIVEDPRRGSQPIANQSLRGDITTTTIAPYFGIAFPASCALFSVIYSPWAWSDTTLVLRTSQADLAQLAYKWNRPGDFVSATFQYNPTPIGSINFGLWANYTWMRVVGDADLEFQNATTGVTRQRTVTATVTQYVTQGGITLGLNF
ncbi:MAG: hypothetical protein HY913_03930 [Desulfomonile tiedjei]|nr:hypothetical protein [Desulfomonile tiedjei]